MYKRVVKKVIKILESTIAERRGPPKTVDDSAGRTFEEIVADFDSIPLEVGSIVFIHSGFKSLGLVRGGPQTVVDALIESLVKSRKITVAMPSFTILGSMHQQLTSKKIFDVRNTPTVFRGIPLAFQQLPNLKRSIHPTHSVMAIGPMADWLVGEHHVCGSSFGTGSPFGKLLEHKSYVMGLGTRLGTVTFYHTLEDIEVDFPFRVYTEDSPYEVTCLDHRGRKVTMQVSAHDSAVSTVRIDKPKGSTVRAIYAGVFEKVANLKYYQVGKAKTWVIDAGDMYDTQKALTYSGVSIYSSEKALADFISQKVFTE